MNERVRVGDVTIILPAGWVDITEHLQAGSPATLARSDGVGALQFSIARYRSGARPNFQARDLRRLLEAFGDKHGLGSPSDEKEGRGEHPFLTADFRLPDQFIRVWYVTNGSDLAFVTYLLQEPNHPELPRELREAAAIIASLKFE